MSIEIELTSHFQDVIDKIGKVSAERMTKAAMAVREEAVRLLSRPGQGREYYVPGTRRKYRASTPGNPPAARTGILRKTIKWSVECKGDEVEGLVGCEQKYAVALEYGSHHAHTVSLNRYGAEKVTLGGHNVAPRPWLRPAFERSEDKVKQILTAPWFER